MTPLCLLPPPQVACIRTSDDGGAVEAAMWLLLSPPRVLRRFPELMSIGRSNLHAVLQQANIQDGKNSFAKFLVLPQLTTAPAARPGLLNPTFFILPKGHGSLTDPAAAPFQIGVNFVLVSLVIINLLIAMMYALLRCAAPLLCAVR